MKGSKEKKHRGEMVEFERRSNIHAQDSVLARGELGGARELCLMNMLLLLSAARLRMPKCGPHQQSHRNTMEPERS